MEVFSLCYIPSWTLYFLTVVVLYIIYMCKDYNVFKKMGVDGPRPTLVFGNFLELTSKGMAAAERDWYLKYNRVFGTFETKYPILAIGRLDMVKEILVKKFNSFVNRRTFEGVASQPPVDNMLILAKDGHWKFIRSKITPTFSGKKLRHMVPQMNSAADRVLMKIDSKRSLGKELEIKSLFEAYAMEIIASTAFGLKVDCQMNPDDPFVVNTKKFFNATMAPPLIVTLFFFPFLIPIVKLTSKVKKYGRFFEDVIGQTLKYRKKHPGSYADFLQLMTNSRKEQEIEQEKKVFKESDRPGLTDAEILSQCVLFFVAGYETTSNTLACTVYNIALHQDVCDKAIQEVDRVLEQGVPDYDNVGKLKYLDMCISETLRLHPPGTRLDRVASRDVTIGGIHIPRGMDVYVPIAAIQRDAEFWPDPDKFDPERFTPEATAKRDPYTYMPFGAGPRMCIGARLALLEAKVALARILQKYRPVRSDKTQVPLVFGKMGNLVTDSGIWIKFDSLTQDNEK